MTKIWSNQVDKKYDAYVYRTKGERYKGTLVVELNKQRIFSESVTISFGAPFGPDLADVHAWGNKAIEAVDRYEGKTTIKEPVTPISDENGEPLYVKDPIEFKGFLPELAQFQTPTSYTRSTVPVMVVDVPDGYKLLEQEDVIAIAAKNLFK